MASYLLPSMLASVLLNIPKFFEARIQVQTIFRGLDSDANIFSRPGFRCKHFSRPGFRCKHFFEARIQVQTFFRCQDSGANIFSRPGFRCKHFFEARIQVQMLFVCIREEKEISSGANILTSWSKFAQHPPPGD